MLDTVNRIPGPGPAHKSILNARMLHRFVVDRETLKPPRAAGALFIVRPGTPVVGVYARLTSSFRDHSQLACNHSSLPYGAFATTERTIFPPAVEEELGTTFVRIGIDQTSCLRIVGKNVNSFGKLIEVSTSAAL